MSTKGYRSITGFNPSTLNPQEFLVSIKQIDHLWKHGPESRFYELQSVAEVLAKPIAIFRGLNRVGKESALCYTGNPSRYGENWQGPGHPDMVFMVGVTESWVVFEWGWERIDQQDKRCPMCPDDAKRRFKELIWKQS